MGADVILAAVLTAHAKLLALSLLAAVLALGLSACGSDSGSEETAIGGDFKPLSGAPAAYSGLAGSAELGRADGGTTASIRLSGLVGETPYMAHLHTEGCNQPEPGGPHFKFDPQGGDEPPNELHLGFVADAKGEGSARTASDREVPLGEAGSIVLHTAGESNAMVAFVHDEDHDHSGGDGADEGGEEPTGPVAIACAELEGAAATAAPPRIVVRDGEPVGGVKRLEYSAGEEIRFEVESDVAEEVHVHGYDVSKDVAAGSSVRFVIPADIEGIFEVELERLGVQIAELRVNP
jgi:hypothetical protein